MLTQALCITFRASGTTQQNSPVGIMTLALRRFRLTVPSSPLVRENVVASPCLGAIIPSGKYHSPALLASAEQHDILSVMHWSPLFEFESVSIVISSVSVCPISVMRMSLLLA
jgi:hypothetical protein